VATVMNPYLGFLGTAKDAMQFYQDVFGGDLTLSTYGENGQAGTPIEHQIMHSRLETPGGFVLMGSDAPPGTDQPQGSSITISLSGHDEAELRGYWDKLATDGTVSVPFEKQMWGDTFGMVTDRFGVPWMVDIMPAHEA
jgi:PhnB protein